MKKELSNSLTVLIKGKKLFFLITFISSIFVSFACYAELPDASNKDKLISKNDLIYLKNKDIWVFDTLSKHHRQFTRTADISNFGVSADLTKIVFVRNAKKLYLLDMATRKESFITDVETDMSNPSISPANDKVVYISKSLKEFTPYPSNQAFKTKVRHVWVIDLKSVKKTDLMGDSPNQYSAPKWSPDGRRISFASGSWEVSVKSMETNNEVIAKVGPGYYSEWIDDKTLAVGSNDKITIYNLETTEKVREIKFQPGFFPAKFSIGTANDLYFEDMSENPDGDIAYLDITNSKQQKLVEDARSPLFIK